MSHSEKAVNQFYNLKKIKNEIDDVDNRLLYLKNETKKMVENYKNTHGCKNYKILFNEISEKFNNDESEKNKLRKDKQTAIQNIKDYLEHNKLAQNKLAQNKLAQNKLAQNKLAKINFALDSIGKHY